MSKPMTRPKRTAEDFAMPSLPGESNPKKPRFDPRNPSTLVADAEEEDAILDLDEIGKSGQQTKRNAVRLDGYDSDSSNENFDARAEAKARISDEAKQKKSKDEEENDMFADLDEEFRDADEDEDQKKGGKKAKKEVRFIEQDEIEGQVSNSRSGGHVSADFSINNGQRNDDEDDSSSSEESVDDEERDRLHDVDEELGAGAKKKHAPKLDAFNMKNEAEEGRFDESGNFVRNAADRFAVHDAWLIGSSSKADIKKAKEAEEKREDERRKKAIEDDKLSESDILSSLIVRLERSETVLEALARLGRVKEKRRPKWQKNKRKTKGEMEVDDNDEDDPAEVKRRETIEAITVAADRLMTRGQTDIYETERELLVRQYRRETGEDWVEPKPDPEVHSESTQVKQWHYRWADARDGGVEHGPYDGPTMLAWNEAGYFGDSVEFREVDGPAWSRLVEFT